MSRLTLARLGAALRPDRRLADLTAKHLAQALHDACPGAAPSSWNRQVATLRSSAAFARRHEWLDNDPTTTIERRRAPEDHTRALSRDDLDRLFTRRDVSVRDRCLWRSLFESAARAQEVLRTASDRDLNPALPLPGNGKALPGQDVGK